MRVNELWMSMNLFHGGAFLYPLAGKVKRMKRFEGYNRQI